MPSSATASHPDGVPGRSTASPRSPRPFNLSRSFAVLSLACIGIISLIAGVLQNRFVNQHLMERDAVITQQLVQRLALTEDPEITLTDPARLRDPEGLGELFMHIANMPDVVRANVFSPDRTIVWSTSADLVGKRFTGNEELERALKGNLVYELVDRRAENKPEHDFFAPGVHEFIENYLPITDATGTRVVGVAEIYKTPLVLFEALRDGRRLTWSIAALGGLFLYASLFWIVHRATRVMQDQQARLRESETLATVGEMASVVAHGIRNPLASIRSSAELALDGLQDAEDRATAKDIIKEVDRMSQWVRELLLFARPERGALEPLQLRPLVEDCLRGFESSLALQDITLTLSMPEDAPAIQGDPVMLGHAVSCLLSNAIDAMPGGGDLVVDLYSQPRGQVYLRIRDTGVGIAEDRLKQVFTPFQTSKRSGIGLGMVLVKRIVERHRGSIHLQSRPGSGTVVELSFPRS